MVVPVAIMGIRKDWEESINVKKKRKEDKQKSTENSEIYWHITKYMKYLYFYFLHRKFTIKYILYIFSSIS